MRFRDQAVPSSPSARPGRSCLPGPSSAMLVGDQPHGRRTRGNTMGDKRAELSYTSATSGTPLLGDTIGGNFDRTAAAFPGRLALVDVPAGLRYSYAEL